MPQPCRGPTGGNEQEGGAVDGEKPAHERDQADHPDERGQDVAGVVVAQRQDHTEREQQRGEPGQPRRDGPQQVDRRTHPVHDAGMATRLLRDVTRLPLPQALLIPRDLRTAHLPLIPRRPMTVPPPAAGHPDPGDRIPQIAGDQLRAGLGLRVRGDRTHPGHHDPRPRHHGPGHHQRAGAVELHPRRTEDVTLQHHPSRGRAVG